MSKVRLYNISLPKSANTVLFIMAVLVGTLHRISAVNFRRRLPSLSLKLKSAGGVSSTPHREKSIGHPWQGNCTLMQKVRHRLHG